MRIFAKKGMENKGILAQLKALLTGKRRMRLSEYLNEYRSRNLALRRGNSFDTMVGNMEHHLRLFLGSAFDTLALCEIDTELCKRFACYLKRAFMFSCLTGLRLSDIRRLRWRDILKEGDGWRFSIIMQKTQEPMQSKLSSEACRWLGLSDDEHFIGRHPAGETVFPLPSNSTLGRILRQWTAEAGIAKPVTFHTARHSYATSVQKCM